MSRFALRFATSRLRPHPVTNNLASGNQSRWYVNILLAKRSICAIAKFSVSTAPLRFETNIILTMNFTTRSVTPPPTSSRPSPPALAVPTSVFLSRTPARPPRPSTAGRSPALSSTSRTSRATPRPSPCGDMPGALAVLLKVREGPVKAGVAYSHVRGCIRILGYPEETFERKDT